MESIQATVWPFHLPVAGTCLLFQTDKIYFLTRLLAQWKVLKLEYFSQPCLNQPCTHRKRGKANCTVNVCLSVSLCEDLIFGVQTCLTACSHETWRTYTVSINIMTHPTIQAHWTVLVTVRTPLLTGAVWGWKEFTSFRAMYRSYTVEFLWIHIRSLSVYILQHLGIFFKQSCLVYYRMHNNSTVQCGLQRNWDQLNWCFKMHKKGKMEREWSSRLCNCRVG